MGRRKQQSTAPAAPRTAPGSVLPNRILMPCPELTLKRGHYLAFQRRLRANIAHRLAAAGIGWPVKPAYGRMYVDVDTDSPEEIERAAATLTEVAGISSVAPSVWLRPSRTRQHRGEPDWPLLEETAAAIAAADHEPGASFAVRVNRADERLEPKAPDIEARLGDAIRSRTPWEHVDLDAPDRTFRVNVYPDGMYFERGRRAALGGIPVGSSGRALALLSGGIDSPVAAHILAKRGCALELFHISANFADSDGIDASVVGELARRISRYALEVRLWAAPSVHFDLALPAHDKGYGLVLFRRFMLRTAEVLAGRVDATVLATGDSLGQVASQTLDNIVATSDATRMPVLRPLVGFNKEEIVELARRIGTFETSTQPYKDCCALLANRPRTRAQPEPVAELEGRLHGDYEELVARTLADAVCLEYDCGRRVDAARDHPRDPGTKLPA